MNFRRMSFAAVLTGFAGVAAFSQALPAVSPGTQDPTTKPATETKPNSEAQPSVEAKAATQSSNSSVDAGRADAYYNYTIGHIYEQQYETTSSPEFATKAIEAYKKAYALDPKSPIIGERLAEMYWKAQRIREAVNEAQQILKRDPNDVPSRRLLGRIYIRSLGDLSAGNGQSEVVGKAIEQFREIYRLEPTDTESALWLARLYRLKNEHDKAGTVLRGILKEEPDNEAAVEQLTQLLLDEGKSDEAVALLEGMTKESPSPTLLDLLGDAYTQTHDLA